MIEGSLAVESQSASNHGIRGKQMALSEALRRSTSLAAGVVLLACVQGAASATDEFQGKWSSNPPRCEQVNGEVDVLTIMSSELEFYEVGCKLSKPERRRDEVRFAARCYKGGSPETSGTVVIRRLSPATIDLALHGFFWITETPEKFHRCAAR
ncbi:hypothetical protein [Bradyrhizobium cenepequi]|uniref:hypothetical protein n=1 Tax=Bradyrhizobium cenepequi TaxID=2821403 RepID=UPI001CE2D254|nr:hypothetical protein [Bradyrhizobium cenepequi]MCA6108956.1 hypothetical protein [Bradyrhizobium cenepequi]